MIKVIRYSLFLVCWMLVSCGGETTITGTYGLPYIPIEVSINNRGEISFSAAARLNTFVGSFSVSAGHTVQSVRNRIDNPVLIVRVDDRILVYELDPQQEYRLFFDGGSQHYREVKLEKRGRDLILELESVPVVVASTPRPNPTSTRTSSSGNSRVTTAPTSEYCRSAFATRLSIGGSAKVVAYPGLVVRESPTTSSNPVYGTSLSPGRIVRILDGPQCNGGMLWWRIETGVITLSNGQNHNMVGWVAEESGNEWLLEPNR
jgi:hypothetical protein